MIYLITTALCFTICTVADRYALSKDGINKEEFTFLISLASCVFMTPLLFFSELYIEPSVKSFAILAAVTADKVAELTMSAVVLKRLSGFETKAWLGTALFLSYFSDIAFFGESFTLMRLGLIILTCASLAAMVRSDKTARKGKYKGIVLPLVLYIFSKFFYGFIIRIGTDSVSPTLSMYIGLLLTALIFLPRTDIKRLVTEKRRGSALVFVIRIPNVIGLFSENMLIRKSLTFYSLEQPLILAMLLFLAFIQREDISRKSLISGVLCLICILAFKLI